jgi:hypothetical protein
MGEDILVDKSVLFSFIGLELWMEESEKLLAFHLPRLVAEWLEDDMVSAELPRWD